MCFPVSISPAPSGRSAAPSCGPGGPQGGSWGPETTRYLALSPSVLAAIADRYGMLRVGFSGALTADELAQCGLSGGVQALSAREAQSLFSGWDKDGTLPPSHRAAEAEGVRLNLLSDYDLTGARHQTGTLVLGYGSLDDRYGAPPAAAAWGQRQRSGLPSGHPAGPCKPPAPGPDAG